jgi:hypothetical protein
VDTPRCLAAAAKLRRRATAMNEFRALRGVKAIAKVLYANLLAGSSDARLPAAFRPRIAGTSDLRA